MTDDVFNAMYEPNIVDGTCIFLDEEGNIVYAGPIRRAPPVAGRTVYLSVNDYARLANKVNKGKH